MQRLLYRAKWDADAVRNDVRKVVVDRGLGLVIARAIVERHEGTISLAAHRGPGTTFVICLPVKPTT